MHQCFSKEPEPTNNFYLAYIKLKCYFSFIISLTVMNPVMTGSIEHILKWSKRLNTLKYRLLIRKISPRSVNLQRKSIKVDLINTDHQNSSI